MDIPIEQCSDSRLEVLFSNGNDADMRGALNELLRRHNPRLRNEAGRLSSWRASDADDLYSGFALQALTKHALYDPRRGRWIAWALRVMHGCASQERRKKRTRDGHVVLNEHAVEMAPSPDVSSVFIEELKNDTEDCIARLPSDRHRHAVILKFFIGLTVNATGNSLGIAPNDAQRLLREALDKLRLCLGRKGYGRGSPD